jgi:hypothetical protein
LETGLLEAFEDERDSVNGMRNFSKLYLAMSKNSIKVLAYSQHYYLGVKVL